MAGRAFIATSGWIYDAWRDDFYEGRPASEWLRFCAGRFSAIEINATHYRLQSIETFRRWRDETPPEFRFAVKAHRYLTHNKKLKDPLGPIRLERHAIEFRHPSWFDDEVAACLRSRRIAVCQSDAADWPLWDAVSTDLVYVRLHGHEVTYASNYTEADLRAWARNALWLLALLRGAR